MRCPSRSRARSAAALVLGAAALAAAAPGAGAQEAIELSGRPIPEDPAWRGYVLDSSAPLVYPRSVEVLGGTGAVRNPRGLLAADGVAARIRASGPHGPSLVLDLGVNTGGRVEVDVGSARGGPLRVAYSEARRYLSPRGDMDGIETIALNDDPDRRFDLVGRGGLFRSGAVHGAQRFLLIRLDGPGAYALDFVRVRVASLRPAVGDYVGRFLSSSRLLNRIWYASAYTLNLSTAREPKLPRSRMKVIDGAKRDRLVWLGDLAMESLVGHYTVRQMPALVRRSLLGFACQQLPDGYIPMASDVHVSCGAGPGKADGLPATTRFSLTALTEEGRLPQYTPMFVITACSRYLLTGDVAGTRELLPVMRRAVAYLDEHSALGLFRVSSIEAINWRAFDTTMGIDAYTNALWVRALRSLAQVEAEIGSAGRAVADRLRARRLARQMALALYDERARMFRANTDSPIANHPQDANVEAVLAGVLSGARARRTLTAMRRRLWRGYGPLTGEVRRDPYVARYVSPFLSGWELLARLEHHQGAAARALLERLWGRMLSAGPGSTVWEAMAPDGTPVSFDGGRIHPGRTSLAHGWSAGPVPALSGYVAGLRPVQPGWRSWLAEPQTLGLRFAQGSVGTPAGRLSSRWRLGPGDAHFRITVEAPPGTLGTVAVPLLGAARTIARDGRLVWRRGAPLPGARARAGDGYVRFLARPGEHTYAWVGAG